MKNEDVGPVPVVEDSESRRLAGIVTDRDLALKVVAENRDPQSVRLEEIMSRQVVTCSPDSEAHEAMKKMSENQVRRIPIVDADNRLVGIISQADVARHMHDAQVGDVVEDISEPAGTRSRSFAGFRRTDWSRAEQRATSAAPGILSGLIGLGIGAGLMYILDPNTGRRRRAVARDKASTLYRSTGEMVTRSRSKSPAVDEMSEPRY
jgi:predicted transcriptional regulator